jgi:ABC-type uncharacterized transport system involved in gliding motility auxiliary subunit
MKRSVKFGLNTAVNILMVLAIAVVVVLISNSHQKRADLTQEKRFTLSPQTIKILKDLKTPVEVIVFHSSASNFQNEAKELTDRYKSYTNQMKVTALRSIDHPMEANEYGVRQPDTIIVKSGDRKDSVTRPTEEMLTNALIKVTQTGKKTLYFTNGHGEKELQGQQPDQLTYASEQLKKQAYEVKPFDLSKSEKIPENCDALVIVGPKSDFLQPEIERIKKYVDNGGGLMVMLNVTPNLPNLNAFLKEKGLTVDNDLIADNDGKRNFNQYFMAIGIPGGHTITKDIQKMAVVLPLARSLTVEKDSKVKWEQILSTTPNAWGKTDLSATKKMNWEFDPAKDKKGPLNIAMAAQLPLNADSPAATPAPGDKKKRDKSRIVVFGNSEFVGSQFFIQIGNGNMFLNSVSWLTEQENLISIAPKSTSSTPLTMNEMDKRFILIISVFLLPGLAILAGIYAFLNRNN